MGGKKTKRFTLLIDDVRNEEMCGIIDEEFDIIARNPADGKSALEKFAITHLWLDNDLATQEEGIDILNWARDNGHVPPNVFLVTSNPVARRRMIEVLALDLNYTETRNGWWIKP